MVAPGAINSFGGRVPRLGSRLLQPNHAQIATNCKLFSGELRSWKRGLQVFAPTVSGTLKTMYRMYSGATDYWLAWADVVDAVKGPIAGDTSFKLYYTGSTFGPRKTNLALAISGAAYPFDYLELGIPAPTVAPGLAVVGGAAANVTRTYVETFVSTSGVWDEEGPPGPPVTVTGRPDGSWNLTALNAAPAGKYAIDRRRVYRTLTGSTGLTNYQLVIELPIATTSYSDLIADSALGVICPSFQNGITGSAWSPPPTDMHSLTQMPNGMMVGASKNILCFCEPYRPWAWPTMYQLALNFDIVSLGVFGNTVVACTKGLPYVYSGTHPSTMAGGDIDRTEPCLSKRGTSSLGDIGVCYPSPNGLIIIGVGGVANATQDFMDRDAWQAFMPSTLVARVWQDKYFATYDTGTSQGAGVIIDRSNPNAPVVDLSLYGTGLYTDPETGVLYYLQNNIIYKWDADSNNKMPFDWKSKTFKFGRAANVGAFQVDADFSQASDASAQAAQLAANTAYNNTILALPETWPKTGKTKGEFDGAMWGEMMWDGSLLRENPANTPSYDTRYILFQEYVFDKTIIGMKLVYSKYVTSRDPFSGPDGFKNDLLELRVSGNMDVRSINWAETHVGLGQV